MMVQNICFLEASYQRSKEDLVYGRTLILFLKNIQKRALSFFDSDEENHKLADFIVSKNRKW